MSGSGGRQIPVQSTAPLTPSVGDLWVDTAGAGAGSDNVLPAATAFTTTTMPNPVTSGNMTVVVLAADNPVLAVALAGDVYPRFLMNADADSAAFCFGDGTNNPFNDNAFIARGSTADAVAIGSRVKIGDYGITVRDIGDGKGDVEMTSYLNGVILHSPDDTRYRITVANDGTLSTTVVP